jgi:hypothetical protein
MQPPTKPPSLVALVGFRALGLSAVVVFAGLFFLFTVSPPPDIQSSPLPQRIFFLVEGAVASGLVPAVLAVYFWLLHRDKRLYLLGLGIVALSVVLHFVVAVVMAHGGAAAVAVAVTLEVTMCAVVLLASSRRKPLQRSGPR